MSTAFIVRTTPRFQENSPPSLRTLPADDDPISHKNLTIVKRISKGKFPIYLTTSKVDNQNYAMKVFSEQIEGSEGYYENELRFASLSHPNILSIVGADKEKTIVQKGLFMKATYILSEYAPYGDMFDFIIKHKHQLDEKLARTYFRQLIDGLEYLHTIGISHLDIKPENLLIGEDFALKIADFDLTHVEGDEKIISGGTRLYRGPEFYNSKSEDVQLETPAASDIYSAGVILFILKTGGVYPHLENKVLEGMNLTELMEKNSSKFWSKHAEVQGQPDEFFDRKFKRLFRKMTKPNTHQTFFSVSLLLKHSNKHFCTFFTSR